MPKYPGISPYDNEKGTLGTAKKRWEKLYVKEIESDTVSGMEAEIENLATTAENSVSAAVSAKNDAVSAKQAAEAAQTAAETAAAGIQSVVETDVDNTLSISGVAADAKVTGDWLRDIAKPVTLDTSLPATAYADEYMKVTVDSDNRVLYGVKRDGTFTWQKGVPKHLQDKINELATPTIENDEYMYVMLDSEGHVLFGVKRDGSFDWQKGLPKPVREKLENVAQTVVENEEYIFVICDADDRALFGIKKDGSLSWQKGIPNVLRSYIYKTVENEMSDRVKKSLIEGKRWAAMGDSLTEPADRYHYYVAQSTGVEVINLGISGSRYIPIPSRQDSFLERVPNLNPDDFDCFTIFGSGNDQHYTLGNVTDTTFATVLGCVNLTLEAYFDVAKSKPIGLITPCPWGAFPTNVAGNWMEEYSNGIITIARKYGVPVMDLYHESGVLPWDSEFKAMYYDSVAIHPNSACHRIFLAPKFREFIFKLL